MDLTVESVFSILNDNILLIEIIFRLSLVLLYAQSYSGLDKINIKMGPAPTDNFIFPIYIIKSSHNKTINLTDPN